MIRDVVANGRSLDEQAGTAAVAGIFCGKVSRGPNDGFAHPLGVVILVLHQERRAREPGIRQPLARDARRLFQLSEKSEGLVHVALVVGDLAFGREESCELELASKAWGSPGYLTRNCSMAFRCMRRWFLASRAASSRVAGFFFGTRVERYDMAPVLCRAGA